MEPEHQEQNIEQNPQPQNAQQRRRRTKFVPPTPTDDDATRIVVKEYTTKSSRLMVNGEVKEYVSKSHRAIPYVETREYKTACRNVYNDCIALFAPIIRDKKKLEAIREVLRRELNPEPNN